jgi:cytochrome P450 PksS
MADRYPLEALFKRWPQLELAVTADSIRWRQRPGLRAIERLPVIAGL